MADVQVIWDEPPESAVLRSRGAGGKYIDLAIALREHPGRWALLPSDAERSEKGAAGTAQNIKRGKVKGFDKGLFEAAHGDRDGWQVWVRYMPPAEGSTAPQGDAASATGGTKPPAADVRAWATKQGLDVPRAGRLPDDLLDKYSEALARGEVGLPLRVLRSAEGGEEG